MIPTPSGLHESFLFVSCINLCLYALNYRDHFHVHLGLIGHKLFVVIPLNRYISIYISIDDDNFNIKTSFEVSYLYISLLICFITEDWK